MDASCCTRGRRARINCSTREGGERRFPAYGKSHVVYPLLAIFFLISYFIWSRVLPDWIQEGGPLIIGLMMLAQILLTIMIERIFTLRARAG